MAEPLDGIKEKLKRADQNIQGLNHEIFGFLGDNTNSVFSYEQDETFRKERSSHLQREVPIRFSVLAGEIIHHLRSCLDHIVWILSEPRYRRDNLKHIQFPIYDVRPSEKEEIKRFERTIKGI